MRSSKAPAIIACFLTRKPDDRNFIGIDFGDRLITQKIIDAATGQPALGADLRPGGPFGFSLAKVSNVVYPG
ncbi:MAG: hypothetical protein CM1200mP29_10320 [Verrucomicrobiota bacterium]|nr:MAG: hypothetical protein CM1200mP29_10320 [Verrucomicrobiota bacterium]